MFTKVLATTAIVGSSLCVAAPASANFDAEAAERRVASLKATAAAVESDRIVHLKANPGQLAISGCFMQSKPLFVTSGMDSIKVWNVRNPEAPVLKDTLENALFENEAMNCGERRTKNGVERFALIGVDAVAADPTRPEHTNVGGGELIVVDVTDPTAARIRSQTDGSTSTHTVACVEPVNCTTAYSAGDDGVGFSIFDLRDLDDPREVDSDSGEAGVQPFESPTAGHKWNFDAAGYGTHTGWGGASMWDTDRPRRPELVTTTGLAGRGDDPRFEGWNDFILHNAFRPNAKAFKPWSEPSFAHGNVLLVTEEDYEQPDCAQAGSFQTWWVKRLNGRGPAAIVPLDKVELADLGTFPSPVGGFCSAHWFDYRAGGLVAAGFYGGGTQILDVRNPKDIKPYAHSVWGASEVWDAMWVPVYRDGRQTPARTNIVYAVDLVRGLDVYAVDVPGAGKGAEPAASGREGGDIGTAQVVPMGVAGGAIAITGVLLRLRRRRT